MPATTDLKQSEPLSNTVGAAAPIIDFARLAETHPERQAAVDAIRAAFRAPGYFCLTGVIDASPTYDNVSRHMQRFFALDDGDPVKQRINAAGQANSNGWMPRFGEPAYQPGTLAHLESFDCGSPMEPADSERPNRWPAIEGFQDEVTALWHEFGDAGRTVLRGIADALAVDTGFFEQRCSTEALSTLRLLHYPPVTPQEQTAASVGIAAHTDFECMTFIAQSAPGLELLDTDGHWRDAPHGSDTVVVLLGDMLERWTNGTVVATGHRVRPRSFRRYSIVRFFAVDDEVSVRPLPQFVSVGRPARYEPAGQRSHTREELERAEANRDALGDVAG